ncbi:unc-45 A [Aphelenchoides avenae]|nr:unc-45 A [Aphelenchus avenae]
MPPDVLEEAVALKNEGNRNFVQGDYAKAVECYTKSLEIEGTAEALANRSLAHLKLEQYAAAYVDADESMLMDKNRPHIKPLFRRAQALIGLKLNDPARIDLISCLKLEPNNPSIKAAFEDLEKKHKPKFVYTETDKLAAKIYAEEGMKVYLADTEKGIDLFTRSYNSYPSAQLLYLRAQAYNGLGRVYERKAAASRPH